MTMNSFVLRLDDDESQLSVSVDDRATHNSSEADLSDIDDMSYLLDTDDHLLSSSANLDRQGDDVYQSSAVSLHSYSCQPLPSMAGVALHSYSQPVSRSMTAHAEGLHNYSQPWPQSTESYTSVHNYCINNESKENGTAANQGTKIFQLSQSGTDEPVCLKIQFMDTYTCHWLDCGESFESMASLVEHSNSHFRADADGLFTCYWKDCTRNCKPFDSRYKIVQHMRIHTLEKPHKCSLCLAEFSTAEGLTKHQRVHTGEKPYPCTYPGCKKAFKNSGDRFKHVKSHETKKPYVCKHAGCTKKYTDPSSLRKHTKSAHPKEAQPATIQTSTVSRKIQAAALFTTSGSETAIDVNDLSFIDLDSTVYSKQNPLLAASGMNNVLSKLPDRPMTSQDSPLDLSTGMPSVDDDNHVRYHIEDWAVGLE